TSLLNALSPSKRKVKGIRSFRSEPTAILRVRHDPLEKPLPCGRMALRAGGGTLLLPSAVDSLCGRCGAVQERAPARSRIAEFRISVGRTPTQTCVERSFHEGEVKTACNFHGHRNAHRASPSSTRGRVRQGQKTIDSVVAGQGCESAHAVARHQRRSEHFLLGRPKEHG